jgi:tetratricopeptide (TPR) repeat protein
MEWLLGDKEFVDSLSAHERAFAYNLEAQCYQFLGELDKAEAGFDRSIEVEPSDRRWYLNRAQFWDHRGRSELAEYDRGMARALAGAGMFPRKPRRALPPLPSATESPFDLSR